VDPVAAGVGINGCRARPIHARHVAGAESQRGSPAYLSDKQEMLQTQFDHFYSLSIMPHLASVYNRALSLACIMDIILFCLGTAAIAYKGYLHTSLQERAAEDSYRAPMQLTPGCLPEIVLVPEAVPGLRLQPVLYRPLRLPCADSSQAAGAGHPRE